MSDVSVLGTGNMGAAIVRTLLAHGLEVTAWNRTPAKLAALADEGASVAPTAAAALSASPLSVAIMADNTAVVQALTPRDGGEPSGEGGLGRVLLNLSTSAPEDVRACREVVEGHGITYLDGAVSGHPQDIGRETSQVLICGDEAAWLAHRAHIELLAGRTHYLGPQLGAASALDLAMVGCFQTVTLCAFIEAAAYYARSGASLDVLRPEAIRLLEKMRLQVDALMTALTSREFGTQQATLDVYLAALDQVTASMRDTGLTARLSSAARETLTRASAQGLGSEGLAAQVELLLSEAEERPQTG